MGRDLWCTNQELSILYADALLKSLFKKALLSAALEYIHAILSIILKLFKEHFGTFKITQEQFLNYYTYDSVLTLKLYFIQRRRERCIIIRILKIAQQMVSHINGLDGTECNRIKTRQHPRHGTQCVMASPTNINTTHNHVRKMHDNSIFGP